MASITGWTRLEPRPRSEDFDVALEARVRDAAWMLARQWQVGEFQADDAGSAVGARLEMDVAPINRYRPGPESRPQPYDLDQLPLEALVEREPVLAAGRVDLRFAAEAGLFFMRLLRDRDLEVQYRSAYLDRYPLPGPEGTDADSSRLLAVMTGRAPDGVALEGDLRAAFQADPDALPSEPSIDGGDQQDVLGAAREWLAWWDALYLEPTEGQGAWVPEKLEYQFSVSAPSDNGEIVLSAREYYTGHLDWYAFDIEPDDRIGGEAGPGESQTVVRAVVPTSVDFGGMPAPRWWEFEDGRVDFGRVEAAPEDLARLLLLEFALVYGNDWLMIPVRLGVGSLCQIRSLVVTDTFGERVDVPPSALPADGAASWGMFYLAQAGRSLTDRRDPDEQYFFLAPTLATSVESPPLEEVVLIRDEMANLAWAIERKVQGPTGRALDRFEEYQERQRRKEPPERTPIDGAEVVYRLASTVPDHWVPLVPVRIGSDQRSIALQRGAMLDPNTGEGILPLGKLLTPNQRLIIDDEEIPRVGLRVSRSYQHSRWTNGASLLWIGRKKNAGRGEGSSGLRSDSI
jgi:hypothetical protein